MPLSENEKRNPLLDHALTLPASKREAYLNEVCGNDESFRQKIEVLLSGSDMDVPEDFLRPSPDSAKLIEKVYRRLKDTSSRDI